MQKILKRTAQAEKQVATRKAKRVAIQQRASAQDDFKRRMKSMVDSNISLSAARRRRREDWELGPLAPRRDTPIKDETGSYWGTLSLNRNMSELGDRQKELACKWAGGHKYLCLKAGDRVAIMEGPDKGKIGAVRSILDDESQVILDGDELKQNVTVSDFLTKAGLTGGDEYTQLSNLRVPIHAVRLIHPVRDPTDNVVRDVIINELKPVNIIHDKPTKKTSWKRVVPGLNIEIPWPIAFEEAESKAFDEVFPDYAHDTLRDAVTERTFFPSLTTAPMPIEVIDELRNKYSKFRTRHEPEYIARKEAEAAAKLSAKMGFLTMQTPAEELAAKRKAEKEALGPPVISDAMLEKIGEFMFKTQEARENEDFEAMPEESEQSKKAAKKAAKKSSKPKIPLEERYWMSKKERAKLGVVLKPRAAKAMPTAEAEASTPDVATSAPEISAPIPDVAPDSTAPPPS